MAEYTNYVWEFLVKDSEGNPKTVGVKAVNIDESLLSKGIPTTDDGTTLLVDEAQVITYISDKIKTDITNILTTEDNTIPSVKAVQDFIKSQSHITIKKVNILPESGESNIIYLVPKNSKTGNKFDEYIWQDNEWELIGNTQIPLDDYVQFTDFAKTDKGGVIKSSANDGKISVDTNGIASLNGYNDLAKSSDLEDYYAYQSGETEQTHHLISTIDQTKLNDITAEATKVTATKDVSGNLTTMTITSGESSETYTFATPEEPMIAFNEIKVGNESAKAVNGKTALTIEAGDGIVLETKSADDGGPSLKISVDTTDIIDIADEIPDDTSKDSAIPNVSAVKAYVNNHEGTKPSYSNGCIDLTV